MKMNWWWCARSYWHKCWCSIERHVYLFFFTSLVLCRKNISNLNISSVFMQKLILCIEKTWTDHTLWLTPPTLWDLSVSGWVCGIAPCFVYTKSGTWCPLALTAFSFTLRSCVGLSKCVLEKHGFITTTDFFPESHRANKCPQSRLCFSPYGEQM